MTLVADQPYVDVQWQVTDKKADPWPEAGWLCFPLKIDQPRFRLGRLGSVTDPAKDIVRSGNFDTFCLNTGLNVIGSDAAGVGLCPIDSPLVGLGYPGLYRYSRTFEPRKPLVLVNLFANVYGVNFQQWIGGTWSSRVRLWPVDGKRLEADLITPAWEARSPLQAAMQDGPAGRAAAGAGGHRAFAKRGAGDRAGAEPGRQRHPVATLGASGRRRRLRCPLARSRCDNAAAAALRPAGQAPGRADLAARRPPRDSTGALRTGKLLCSTLHDRG